MITVYEPNLENETLMHPHYIHLYPIWRFPKMGVLPVIIHVIFGVSIVNHPAIGGPPWLRKPTYIGSYLQFHYGLRYF